MTTDTTLHDICRSIAADATRTLRSDFIRGNTDLTPTELEEVLTAVRETLTTKLYDVYNRTDTDPRDPAKRRLERTAADFTGTVTDSQGRTKSVGR